MFAIVKSIVRAYQKILVQYLESGIPQDILLPSISREEFEKLCLYATNHFTNQDLIPNIKGQVYVVGDLHGNIHDLLRILQKIGDLTVKKILFLGDYVDRGPFSVEVITLLFSLACFYPENVFLIRGNHEFRKVNEFYGFKQQVVQIFDNSSPWEKANEVFDFLPIAATINEEIFCVHGGIAPEFDSISDLEKYQRPIYTYEDDLLYDILWSDPSDAADTFIPSTRGSGHQYGHKSLAKFLANNKLKALMRGHQCVKDGIERHFGGMCVTVFSSSNYNEAMNNIAGFLYVDEDNEEQDFFLESYESKIDREHSHFIQVNTKNKELTDMMKLHTVTANIPRIGSSQRLVPGQLGLRSNSIYSRSRTNLVGKIVKPVVSYKPLVGSLPQLNVKG